MRIVVRVLILAFLLSVECAALYAVLHPKVSAEYKAYYVDRISSDWPPTRYSATPEQGMVLAKPGLPDFVQATHGFSFRESWGRWTDAAMDAGAGINMNREFRGPVCVVLTAYPSPAEVGKQVMVVLGRQSAPVVLSAPAFADYYIDFDLTDPAHTLDFRFPGSVPKHSRIIKGSMDDRRLGLAISLIRIFESPCHAVSRQGSKTSLGRHSCTPITAAAGSTCDAQEISLPNIGS
jgi:hypothetical protein